MREEPEVPPSEFEHRPELIAKRARAIMAQRAVVFLVTLLVMIFMTLLAWDTYVGLQQRDRLLDCTTPGGACYQHGQERTGEAIKTLVDNNLLQEIATRKVVTLAAYCANRSRSQTVEEIEKCVERGLKGGKSNERGTDLPRAR